MVFVDITPKRLDDRFHGASRILEDFYHHTEFVALVSKRFPRHMYLSRSLLFYYTGTRKTMAVGTVRGSEPNQRSQVSTELLTSGIVLEAVSMATAEMLRDMCGIHVSMPYLCSKGTVPSPNLQLLQLTPVGA